MHLQSGQYWNERHMLQAGLSPTLSAYPCWSAILSSRIADSCSVRMQQAMSIACMPQKSELGSQLAQGRQKLARVLRRKRLASSKMPDELRDENDAFCK